MSNILYYKYTVDINHRNFDKEFNALKSYKHGIIIKNEDFLKIKPLLEDVDYYLNKLVSLYTIYRNDVTGQLSSFNSRCKHYYISFNNIFDITQIKLTYRDIVVHELTPDQLDIMLNKSIKIE